MNGQNTQTLESLTADERFFYEHAGYSVAQGETEEQGKVCGAKALAQAEKYAREQNWTACWDYEQESPLDVFGEPCPSDPCEDTDCAYAHYDPENEFLVCVLRSGDGDRSDGVDGSPLASLGMIEAPSNEYRRVVEAELALEAMHSDLATAR